MGKKENVEIYMSVIGADDSRVDIDKVRQAVEDFGDEGVKVAQPITNSLQNIQKAWDNVADKIATGRAVTTADIAKMVQQHQFLSMAVEQAFGSAAKAPQELQDALKKVESQIKHTSQVVGEMDDAVKDNAANVKIAAGQWPGLGDAIEAVGGKAGAATAKIALIGKAFQEGWQMGMEANKLMKADMSEWEKTLERFGMKLNIITKGIFDNIINGFNVVTSLASGDIDEIREAVTRFKDEGIKNLKAAGEALTTYGADWDKLHPPIEKVKKAKEEAAAAAKKAAEEAKKLAEEQAKLREKIDETTLALQKNKQAMDDLEKSAMDAEHSAVNRTSDMAYYGRTVAEVTDQIAAQRDLINELRATHAENDPVVVSARERLVNLETSLKHANQRYSEAKEEVRKYEDQQKTATAQIAKAKEEEEKLTLQKGKLNEELAKTGATAGGAATSVQATATAATAAGEAAAAASPKIVTFRDEAGKLHMRTVEVAETTKAAAGAVSTLGDAAKTTADALSAIKGPKSATDEVNNLHDALERARDRAIELRKELEEIAELGGDEGGGGDTKSSDSPKQPTTSGAGGSKGW